MTVLDMNPATLPADAQALYEKMSARRKAQGQDFGGPYIALLNHPELARRVEELGFFLKFEGALPRTIYQFIVLTVARATGADYEWQDHIAHARAAGLPAEVIDCIGSARTGPLPEPYALVQAILTKTTAWQVVPDDLQHAPPTNGASAAWSRSSCCQASTRCSRRSIRASTSSTAIIKFLAAQVLTRHARPCAGHPRFPWLCRQRRGWP
jgi:4-carboxymuconolactone decarboxylase